MSRRGSPNGYCEIFTCSAGDFNGDGRQDAACPILDVCSDAAPDEQATYVLLLARADGNVDVSLHPVEAVLPSLSVGDINHDGRDDLVGTGSYILAGDEGLGALVEAAELPPPPNLAWDSVLVGDFAGGGEDEVIVGEDSTGLLFPDRVENPGQSESLAIPGFEFLSTFPSEMDVNGDGIADIPVRDDTILVSEVSN